MADTTYSEVTLDVIGFGSCSKPWKNQSIFNTVLESHPQAWLWTGDSYYTLKRGGQYSSHSFQALQSAQQSALKSKPYQALVSSLSIPPIGTYDDHDFGVNDGGKEVSDKRRRMELFWDYLDVPQDSPLRRRDGMFSSTVIGSGSRKVKVIAMDTRTHRDRHIIPGVRFASTLTNSVTRLFAVATGLNRLQSGTVLGEAQWQWLEAQLQHSKEEQISVNIIISSIQIFTPNPMVESWMHFPLEKERLVDLLNQYEPKTLILLSGDVHIGFIQPLDGQPAAHTVEVTSSGLTHDCTDGGIPGFVCKLVWRTSTGFSRNAQMHIGKNFGTIELDWSGKMAKIAVRDHAGNPRLVHEKPIGGPFQRIGMQEYPMNVLLLSTRLGILLVIAMFVFLLAYRGKKTGRGRVNGSGSKSKSKAE